MNEKAVTKEKDQKDESVHEEVKEDEGTKKRKLGTRKKLKAKRRKHASPGLTQKIPFFLITKPQFDPTKPAEDIYLNTVTRSNGRQRFFSTLMGVLSILDREDLKDMLRTSNGTSSHKKFLKAFDNMLGEIWGTYNHYEDGLLETEDESTMALELIKFVKQQLEELGDSDDDDDEGERV
ncbi:hypothetical protein Tco_1127096 [Tanacetum coccineum]